MPLWAGEYVGAYEIIGALGKGGMGEVYRARDAKLDREVAVKVLPGALARDHERLIRFEREAKALAALNHPNIAQIYAVEGTAFIMELVPGETIASRMKCGPMPVDEVLQLAEQMAAALDAAHEKGIVHRDFKPGNVMVTPDGVVKVLDFGLVGRTTATSSNGANDQNPEDSPTLTRAATQADFIIGTAAYMAPEQASGKPVDKRADIWAFGVVVWEMLSGKRLFEGETVSHVLAAVLTEEPDLTVIPERVRPLVARCLERDPKKRLRDIGDAMGLVTRPMANAMPAIYTKAGRGWPIAAAVFALTTGLALWAPWHRAQLSNAGISVTRLALIPPNVNDVASNNFGSAISPDGLTLAFVGTNSEANAVLHVRALDSLEARMIPGSEGAGRPFWSPDSKYIAWFARQALWKIPVAGGGVEKITSIAGAGRGGTWNRDGIILFADQNNRGINRVPAQGGAASVITQFDSARGEDAHYYPQFLPDGKHFLYYRRATSTDRTGMYVGTLDDPKHGAADSLVASSEYRVLYASGHLLKCTGEAVIAQPFDLKSLAITSTAFPIAGPIARNASNAYIDISATENGIVVYGTAKNNAERTLRWLDRAGKPLSTVGANISEGNISISPDGTRVLGRFAERERRGNWVLNLERGTRTRVTFDATYNDAVWSPSGNEIAYATPGIEGQVYVRSADGSGSPRKITGALLGRGMLTQWTSDRRLLSYGPGQQAIDVYETPVAGGTPKILIGEPDTQGQAQLSPDGRWIAYSSRESSRTEVYVTAANARPGKWQISVNGGNTPRWRRDGREIIYLGNEGLVSVPVTLSANAVALGKPTSLFAPPGPWDLAPDFSRVLVAMAPENDNTPFIFVQNWTRLAK